MNIAAPSDGEAISSMRCFFPDDKEIDTAILHNFSSEGVLHHR